ncbi:MAG: propanediol/glycerol family dehydratase large subunit [Deltaproteobacteria bacterium]|nr:propanediol/glycerol family dehydratase large subunit [Deltaproteobacteria bacterium]
MPQSKRFELLAQRAVNKDSCIHEWPEKGLVNMESAFDPKPSLKIANGIVKELDGKKRKDFDIIDHFIIEHALNLKYARKAMAMDSRKIARMIVDINVPRNKIIEIFKGLTPAKILQVVNHLNPVEMMIALQKMRARKTPANQAHVTNRRDNPVLLAADAAEGALRGFAEEETTVAVPRSAAMNALAILVGSQTGRGGVLTQCAVEEALNLKLGMLGLTTYSETLSVYGTESTFKDGDDTPWSKAFLASAYASRGVKVRFTSGTGSEVLMGNAEGKSMLYLEIRCLLCIKGAGSQGVQNGSISCIALPLSLPGGGRTVLAENLVATLLDLEIASGNDAMSSHSDMRKSAKLMTQFLPGTDFICSGYSSMPRMDNMFGGGNFDSEDYDDFLILQRDFLINGGIFPVQEEEVINVRRKAAKAMQAIFKEFDFPSIKDEEVEAVTTVHWSPDMPERNRVEDLKASERILKESITGVEIARALDKHGFQEVAKRILEIQKQRVTGDYLQTSAIFDANFNVLSAINDSNDYQGPGTGYRLEGETKRKIINLPQAKNPRERSTVDPSKTMGMELVEIGAATAGSDSREVVIGLGPAFGTALQETITGLPLDKVLKEMIRGIEEEGIKPRVIKIYETSDCAFIGHKAAQLSGSGVAIGIQSKGTVVIHQRDLPPLNNLELLSQASNATLDTYHTLGKNAARYAKGEATVPLPTVIDNMARLKYIVQTTLMHMKETEQVNLHLAPKELRIKFLEMN